MTGMTFEIVLVLGLIVLNGLFSLSEIALVSSRKARLQQLAETGDPKAAAALALANEPEQFLSTVQIGITLIGILTGAFSGATVARVLGEQFKAIPALAPYSGTLGLGLVVVTTTYLSLVVGELVPKRVGMNSPERIAMIVAGPMRFLSRLAAPAVWLLSVSTALVTRLMGMRPSTEPPITEEELRLLLRQGTHAGVFAVAEREMLERVFRLMDRRVASLMIPRREMACLDLRMSPQLVRERILAEGHSRWVVCEGGADHVLGFLLAQDALAGFLSDPNYDLQTLLRPVRFVPESMHAAKLLRLFQETGDSVAIVVDEHGGTSGMVGAMDIMEAVVGEVPAIGELTEPRIVQREDGSWLLDGALPVEELKELLQVRKLPEEGEVDYTTLGGLISAHLGRIPAVSDHFEWQGFRFEVVDMDDRRVDRVLVGRTA
jgi:putative hemolysin